MNLMRFYQTLLIALLLLGATGIAAAQSFELSPSAAQSASVITAVQSGVSDTLDPDPPVFAGLRPALPCLTRLKDFPYGVHYILVGTRNDGADANFARGSFVRSEYLSLAQFDSVHNPWLFASRNACEESSGEPGSFPVCTVLQPFTSRSPSQLEVSLREDGLVTLAEGSWPWSSDFYGQCMGDMLYGYNGLDMWTLSFSTGPKPPG